MFESLKYNLKHNRRSTIKTATAWALFSVIILVFVFWGLTPQDGITGRTGSAATVNDSTISMLQLNETVDRMSQDPRFQQFQQLGADAGRQMIQQQALSQLVEAELVRQTTSKQHILTSDAEVRDVITSIPAFQEDGRFKRELYMRYLQQARKSPGEFESEIRKEQALRRTVELFRSALKPLPMESEKQKALSQTKANLEFVALRTDSLITPDSISEGDVAEFLSKPENEAKVKEYFESHKTEFAEPEQIKARHILVRASPDDPEGDAKALEKAKDLAGKAKAGEFAKLARENSDDAQSKSKGGDLGFFARGRMGAEFDQAAFALKEGEVSDPIKTENGYHIIQVQEKRPAKTYTLDDKKSEIAQKLISQERSATAIAELEGALKKQDTKAVTDFISAQKLKWEETGPFGLDSDSIPKIGPNDELIRTAFKLNSENPYAPTLVRQGPVAYLARFKAVPSEKDAKVAKGEPDAAQRDAMMEYFASSRRSEDSLKTWLESLRKEAKITTNPQLFSRQ